MPDIKNCICTLIQVLKGGVKGYLGGSPCSGSGENAHDGMSINNHGCSYDDISYTYLLQDTSVDSWFS